MKNSFCFIQQAQAANKNSLLSLAVSTGLFSEQDAQFIFGDILERLTAGKLLDNEHIIAAFEDDSLEQLLAWAYFAESSKAPQVWDLWWIGTHPTQQGKGIGASLLNRVEEDVKSSDGRLLIIETSAIESMHYVRSFYTKMGYLNCGTIPDFYAAGEGKVTFAKSL